MVWAMESVFHQIHTFHVKGWAVLDYVTLYDLKNL